MSKDSTETFIHFNRKLLSKGQIKLLRYLNKVQDFHLDSHSVEAPIKDTPRNTAIFRFSNGESQGEVKVVF